jgi:hypothetical protein
MNRDRSSSASPGSGQKDAPLLHAVKTEGRGRSTAGTLDGVTYSVAEDHPARVDDPGEKRRLPRLRTRLRSGKVLAADNGVLVDCLLYDRSARGARLRLFENIDLPRRIRFYDEDRGDVVEAAVAWRQGREVGIVIAGKVPDTAISPAERARIAGRGFGESPFTGARPRGHDSCGG